MKSGWPGSSPLGSAGRLETSIAGFSKGVENEELIKRRRFTDDGEPIPFPTMAEGAFFLRSIRMGRPICSE